MTERKIFETLEGRPGRGGMSVNAHGDQGTLGFWPREFDSATPGSWVGRLFVAFKDVLAIGQRLHQLNEAVRAVKFTGQQPPDVPELEDRAKLARADQTKLAAIEAQVKHINSEILVKRSDLQPFDYGPDGIMGAMTRQELRATLRSAPDKTREELLQDWLYIAAALELRPEQAGLTRFQFDALREQTLLRKFPDQMESFAEGAAALEVVMTPINTVGKAVENELLAIGQQIEVKVATPPKQKAWA